MSVRSSSQADPNVQWQVGMTASKVCLLLVACVLRVGAWGWFGWLVCLALVLQLNLPDDDPEEMLADGERLRSSS